MKEYGDTLNLPKTDFPMRGNLPAREPDTQKKWEDMGLYHLLMERGKGLPKYILHDGPPFANGDIHTGHTLNKVLKDIVVKHKTMSGFCAPYVPGWDTHGLPIEQQAIKKLKISKSEITPAEFRKMCRDFALKYVNNQREQFKRLGIIGDWENPYLTLAPEFEASQIRVFGEMVDKGFIYRGLKPVIWCTDCETALAEAEIEYAQEVNNSIYVKFRVVDDKGLLGDNVSFVIWTTTTWTLPGNVAISVNPNFEYSVVAVGEESYVIASELVESAMGAAGTTDYKIVKKLTGAELEGIWCKHPFLDRKSLVIVGDHVTLEAGTGCVHTAPGHGAEDYVVCRNYPELPIIVPVDAKGVLNEHAGEFAGMYYKKSNQAIIERLQSDGALFAMSAIEHQYPHCWRCGEPIVFRATEQWFASVEQFKQQALDAIKQVKWVPEWGEERISNMVQSRSDWCISRQRLWGMPIPIFYCDGCNEPIVRKDLIDFVADIFAEKGSNAWFELDCAELMPRDFKCACGCGDFRKETDTMDVWFDSGTSHVGVLEQREELVSPADMYLEGNDQYRGWFQSSLLTSITHSGVAPYKTVLTHGFVVDGEGRKMSKSIGNGIDPLDIIKEYGADILRLWVVSCDYRADVKISKDILKQLSEIYRKIRNTARYVLGNIYDFNPDTDMVPREKMSELDIFALMRLNKLIEKVRGAYESYEYHIMYHALHNFCVVDMSNFYLDIIKDRLYTEKSASLVRRSAQTAMYIILDALVRLLAPIISFTAEEIWGFMPHRANEGADSVFFCLIPEVDNSYYTKELDEKWAKILALRADVSKALEVARADKLIGNSLEAKVAIFTKGNDFDFFKGIEKELGDIFIVSGCCIENSDGADYFSGTEMPQVSIKVDKAEGSKCPRCWVYSQSAANNADGVCDRCMRVLK